MDVIEVQMCFNERSDTMNRHLFCSARNTIHTRGVLLCPFSKPKEKKTRSPRLQHKVLLLQNTPMLIDNLMKYLMSLEYMKK